MAVHHHQPHLLDFSAPPNAMPMEAPQLAAFHNDGLLALHHVDGMPAAGGGGVLAAPPPWPQAAVSLSLFNYSTAAGASLVQPFTAVAPNHQLCQVAASSACFELRSSRYLGPVKELLTELCSLEGDLHHAMVAKQRAPAGNKWDGDAEASSGLWGSPSLMSTMDLMELERRKARLLSMVEEVDRRYRRYREQMRSVELSFEAVAGGGAAQVYTRLARRAMSRHFRCLRDALVAQVRALRTKAETTTAPPAAGATKGETPRLRVLDLRLRQQRAFQQPGAVESYPWRPQRGLPERAVAVLRAWLFEHFLHPYPNDVDKHILARQTGLSRSQVSNWFINARVRLWKPMIEDMYKQEVNQQQSESANQQNPSNTAATVKSERSTAILGAESYQHQKLRSLVNQPTNSMVSASSSIVTDGGDHHHLFHGYYPNLAAHGNSHSAVSLTLGLQQQPFALPMMQQQRSAGLVLLEAEEQLTTGESVLPCRNLMGSQPLHDYTSI